MYFVLQPLDIPQLLGLERGHLHYGSAIGAGLEGQGVLSELRLVNAMRLPFKSAQVLSSGLATSNHISETCSIRVYAPARLSSPSQSVRIEPLGRTSIAEAEDAFREQASALADGGVDLFMLETFRDLNEISAAIAAAEGSSDGEIVAVATPLSDPYHDVALHWAILVLIAVLAWAAACPSCLNWWLDLILGGWRPESTLREVLTFVMILAVLKFTVVLLILKYMPLRLALTPGATKTRRVRRRAVSVFKAGAERRTIGRTVLGISDVEHAGIDLLQHGECRTRRCRSGLRLRRTAEKKGSGRNAHSGGAKELAAIPADLLGHASSRSWGLLPQHAA